MPDLRVTADLLNLRDHVGLDSKVLVKLPAGTQVAKLDATPDHTWFRVQTQNGVVGWISAKYAVDVAAPAAPAAQPAVTMRVEATALNLRGGPGTGNPVIVTLPHGARVTRLDASADGKWLRVKTEKGTEGWLSAEHVTVDDGIDPDAPRPDDHPWYAIAWAERGVAEFDGPKDNPRIAEYQKATDLGETGDDIPWCSCFVNWVMKQAAQPRTKSAAARSWEHFGREIDKPERGCIVVFTRGDATHGHVSLFVSQEGDMLRVLGGNQGNRVQISKYPLARKLTYRMPS
ncbi:MAG TPA: TIGR02594 family protein [Longimicrobiaceae bacterium]